MQESGNHVLAQGKTPPGPSTAEVQWPPVLSPR
jgi:hypothetical protein